VKYYKHLQSVKTQKNPSKINRITIGKDAKGVEDKHRISINIDAQSLQEINTEPMKGIKLTINPLVESKLTIAPSRRFICSDNPKHFCKTTA
jgi:hypothetical protein